MPIIVSVPERRAMMPVCNLCGVERKCVYVKGELFPLHVCVVCIRAMANAAYGAWPKDMVLSIRR